MTLLMISPSTALRGASFRMSDEHKAPAGSRSTRSAMLAYLYRAAFERRASCLVTSLEILRVVCFNSQLKIRRSGLIPHCDL